MDDGSGATAFAHSLRQPLNIIQLSCANLRVRLSDALDQEAEEYLQSKLSRIEEQVARMTELINTNEELSSGQPAGADSGRDTICTE
jgi:nitrogen fixation/metabolism regulation signal transduction histidine kinase